MEAANAGLQKVLVNLEQAAGTDRLTGAWNRRRFEEAARAEMALARRRKEPVSLLMLDLDHFKRVNDSLGHETGDAVLVAVAQTWMGILRTSDALVRWGGEEFLALLPTVPLDGAMVLSAKLQEATRALRFPGIPQVTVSIGVAEYLQGEELKDWIQRADTAMYLAKKAGRDRIVPSDLHVAGPADKKPILELQWEESNACGNTLIDSQHLHLVELANSLLVAITDAAGKDEVALRWNRLVAHTAQHFYDEERILAEVQFNDLPHHTEEHRRLLARIREFQNSVTEGTPDIGEQVTFLALDLIKGHLISEDSTYFKDLRPDQQ